MSSTGTRRRKRGQHEPPNANDGAVPVTLQSREFIEKLVREYCENDRQAQTAQNEAKRAFADVGRFEQQAKDLETREQANLAQIRQAQAELQQAQAKLQQAEAERQQVFGELQEVHGFADKARTYGASQTATHERFAGQAADAKTVLESFDIPVPEDTAPAEQTGAPSTGALVTATDGFKVDPDDPLTGPATPFALTPDPKINDSVDRLMHHHDTDPAGEAGVA
jgi:hypothetical protein